MQLFTQPVIPHDRNSLHLSQRTGKFLQTDDDEEIPAVNGGIFTEKNFTNLSQIVEKSVVDLFSEPVKDGNSSDIYFNEPLQDFNMLFIKNSW